MHRLLGMACLESTAQEVVVDRCGMLYWEACECLLYKPNLLHICTAVATGRQMKGHADVSWHGKTVIQILTGLLRDLPTR